MAFIESVKFDYNLDSTSNNFKMALKSENIRALAKFNFHPLGERKNAQTC